jgi:hypothetical protein
MKCETGVTHQGFRSSRLQGPVAWSLTCLGFLACLAAVRLAAEPANGQAANTLPSKERSADWKLLFDGKTTKGWRGFRKPDFPTKCWAVEQGVLKRVKASGEKGEECGDIVTVNQYDNFEFQLEWKIEPGGNSGVKYLILEDRPASWEQAYLDYHVRSLKKAGRTEPPEKLKPERWKYMAMGFELQLIDDDKNSDARQINNQITGALYDLMAPKIKSTLSLTNFNTARIVVQGDHIEHWINGTKVLEFERGSQELQKSVNSSKFRHLAGFGSIAKGHIALQDHNSEVSFRDIKIRELGAK